MKALRKTGKSGGFTLVEMMTAAALWSLAASMLFTIYIGQQQNFLVGNSYVIIHKEARMAMDWMTKDIRWTIEIVPTHDSYTTGNNCVILKVPSINSDGDVINIKNHHDYIIYKLSGGTPTGLERIIDAKEGAPSSRTDGTKTVAENINSLTFSDDGTGLSDVADLGDVICLEIDLAIGKKVTSVDLSDNLSTIVKLRNKE